MPPASESTTTRVRAGIVDVLVLSRAPQAMDERPALDERPAMDERPAPVPADPGCVWRVLILRRGADTRCTGAWEIVHGRIEAGERPTDAALREVQEETGLTVERLYSITVNPFYLSATDTVELAVVFAAVVSPGEVRLGQEHDAAEWRTPADAADALAWPRERDALAQAMILLGSGDAGPVEDVLRVR